MLKYFLFCFPAICFASSSFAQSGNSNNKFTIEGIFINRDTGKITIWHNDENNNTVKDTIQINNGRFIYSGTVNRADEAFIWTDLKNINFDDSSVLRFLLEPKSIKIVFDKNAANVASFTGSPLQAEKENWDREKLELLKAKAKLRYSGDSLYSISKTNPNPAYKEMLSNWWQKIDSINGKIKAKDLSYVEKHPTSFLSGYLLQKQNRKLPIDSLQTYYSMLSDEVRKSNIGIGLLGIIYPLTNDSNFRKNNAILGKDFNESLLKIQSIYQFALNDSSGNKIEFSQFKNKYLVIDFWASWCVPCVANIPYLNALEKNYKNENIQFISISFDKDPDKWKQSILKNNFEGLHLNAPEAFNSLIAVYCKVLWVPHYMIFDKNGNVLNKYAPQAINPELKVILDKLIKK